MAFDPVRAVLDSADITTMRTGAIAAVAARQSLAALSEVVKLEQVRVWSRDQGRSEEISFETAMATAVGSVEQAVAGAGLAATGCAGRHRR